MSDQSKDHCPRCKAADLWEVKSSGEVIAMQCQDCGFVFSLGEIIVGVDLDL
jgi:Zn ribbon nucleic-acid-binding protein